MPSGGWYLNVRRGIMDAFQGDDIHRAFGPVLRTERSFDHRIHRNTRPASMVPDSRSAVPPLDEYGILHCTRWPCLSILFPGIFLDIWSRHSKCNNQGLGIHAQFPDSRSALLRAIFDALPL